MLRSCGRFRLSTVASLVAVVLVLALPAGSAADVTFADGDLIVGTAAGLQWLRGDGSQVATLEDAFPVPFPVSPTSLHWKAEFDPSGRLWVTPGECCGANKVVAYDTSGESLGAIVDPFNPDCGEPTDIAFDAKGNAYIGDWGSCDGEPGYGAKKFDPDGTFLELLVALESDGIDLAADQCTLFWQNANDERIDRRDVCVADSPTTLVYHGGGDVPFGMRIVPDGSILSVEPGLGAIVRVDSTTGAVLQTYDAPDCVNWLSVVVSRDGTSFWSTCFVGWTPVDPGSPTPYEFDVASGDVLRVLATEGVVRAVRGGFRAAQDRTRPTVSFGAPLDGATYTLGQRVLADYECADLGGSDVASCNGNAADGAAIDTSSVGTKTFQVTATDGAGNSASASATYQVVYNFAGFFNPIDNPPTFNVLPAGKGVKLIFRLAGNQGLNIFEPGYPSANTVACNPGAPQDKVEKTVKISSSKLTYEPKPNQYVYFWSTNNTWRGSCKELVLKLKDGTEHRALFKFT